MQNIVYYNCRYVPVYVSPVSVIEMHCVHTEKEIVLTYIVCAILFYLSVTYQSFVYINIYIIHTRLQPV